MQIDFKQMMGEALTLTRSGKLGEAAEAIQRALRGAGLGQPPGAASGAAETIDVQARVVEDGPRLGEGPVASTGDRAGAGPAPSAQTSRPAGDSTASPAARSGPRIETGVFHHPSAGARAWRLAVPAGPAPAQGRPLLVMLHGCTQDAADFARGTRMDRLAGDRGWLVLYPQQSAEMNPQQCWNWFKPRHQGASTGEPALLAALVREVIQREGGDPQRVYVAGLSAGGAMAAILGAAYPELFAAVGVHSGLAAGAADSLPKALAAMAKGGRGPQQAQPRPTIVLHGDRDKTVAPVNADAVVASVLPTGAGQPTSETPPGATRRIWRRPDGSPQVEQWTLHGAGHAWSGGDAAGSYAVPGGVDASRAMLDFFEQQRQG